MLGRYSFLSCFIVAGVVACAPTIAPLSLIGQWHEVKQGETLAGVCAMHGADEAHVRELNALSTDGEMRERKQIFIPLRHGRPPGDGKPTKPKKASQPKSQEILSKPLKAKIGPVKQAESECLKSKGNPCFLWPTEGKVVRRYEKEGENHHDGIDISAANGTAVVAVESGEVLYSGDAIKGYGNLILVRHKNNIITVYAHNARNIVKEGTKVKRGEKIAEVGMSGAATESHLHFEVRVSEQPANPMIYLPSKE